MAVRNKPCSACRRGRWPGLSTWALLALVLPTDSYAQLTSTTTDPTSLSSSPTATPILQSSLSSSLPETTTATLSTSSSISHTTLATSTIPSSSAPSPTLDSPSAATSAPDSGNDPVTHGEGVAANFYFFFLALLVMLGGLVYWGLSRRNRRAKVVRQNDQTNALAQDLQAWVPEIGDRRSRRFGREGIIWRNRVPQQEGLDERGEAPPPYANHQKYPQPGAGENPEGRVASSPTLTIPPRALHPDDAGRPPRYEESVRSAGSSDRPGTVETTTRSHNYMNASTSELVGQNGEGSDGHGWYGSQQETNHR